jgi:hypothetical protein
MNNCPPGHRSKEEECSINDSKRERKKNHGGYIEIANPCEGFNENKDES